MQRKKKSKEDKMVLFAQEVVEHTCENIPVLEVSGSGSGDITYVDPNIFDAELSQMVQVKAEDHMSDYKSLLTKDFEDNTQESDENGNE